MKRLSMMSNNSLTRKAIATFTSVAFVMAVALPAPVYAAEGESASTQSELTTPVASNEEAMNFSAEPAAIDEPTTSDVATTDPETTDATGETAVENETSEADASAAAASEEAPATEEPQANEAPIEPANVADPAVTTDPEASNATDETAAASETPEADANLATTSEETPAPKKSQANRMMHATAASPAASIAVGDFEVQGDSSNYTYENGVLTVLGDVIVKTVKTTTNHIVIAENANVSLAGVNIDMGTESAAAIKVNAGVKAVLTLVQDTINTVIGGTNHAGIEVSWQNDSTYADLTIKGEGSLAATGGSNSAGVGGSVDAGSVYGNITIESGTIKATGTGGGAGIGSATTNNGTNKPVAKEWGTITINGGDITATGSNSAGIGGGNHVDSGKVIINDGNIVATGASGIGTGTGGSAANPNPDGTIDPGPGSTFADITINGGTIIAMATGDDNWGGAGIGGGAYTDAKVTINGGTIDAYGGNVGSGHNSLHHGGAGIGGGYEGHADITITGGTVNAFVGENSSAAAIGSGATPNSNPARGNNGRVGNTNLEGTSVVISGGTVNAYASGYTKTTDDGSEIDISGRGGAGIGGGVSADNVSVAITGGTVTAYGAKSDDVRMQGGAGIGGGLQGDGQTVPGTANKESSRYHSDTAVSIAITGGNVIAIGGWGAAGIGSGAKNVMADSITIDAENANVQAYADGTKFAIDTPNGEAAGSNADVTGNLLQGTFVHAYKHEGNVQGTEGLKSIILKDEATGTTKTLILMPDGYRSYATDVVNPGIYSIYTDSNTIGATGENQNGSGAHFSVYGSDQFKGDVEGGMPVTYGVVTDKLSNYTYLFPVKTIVVDTAVEIADPGNKTMKEALAGVNQSFFFAIHDHKGETLLDNDGNPWIQEIKVVNGQVMGSVYFANMNDGKFEIWEVDENGNRLSAGTELGEYLLTMIRTEHGSASDNNAELGEGVWSDVVRVINTLALSADPVPPVTPDDPQDPEDPVTPDDPQDPEDPVTPDDPQDPEDPATPEEPQDPENPENPVTPIVPAGPTTPTTPPTTPGAPTGTATPTTLGTPTGTTTPTTPAASIAVEDGTNPLAASIEDEATPLAHDHGVWCWVHWWIILGIIATAVYTVVVVARRQKNSSDLKNIDDEVTGGAKSNDAQSAPNFKLQPAMSASMEG